MVISSGTLFAQAQPKATDVPAATGQNQSEYSPTNAPKSPTVQTIDNNQNVTLPKTPDANILPTPEKDNTADIKPPTNSPEVKQTIAPAVVIVGGIVIGYLVAKFRDCGKEIACYFKLGVETVERTALEQISGCGTADTPEGLQDCQTKYSAILNGGSLADVQEPGALFIAGNIADAGLRMPVPINTDQYLATINPLTPTTVNAQAVDELDTSGLVKLWQNVRNAAFAFSALALVVIGFMIMFRTKLDPRTSITAMNSLPKIIFAMILIYFSFAISGFMLDMGRLALQVVYRTIPFSGGAVASGLLELMVIILLGFLMAAGSGVGVVIGVALLLLALIIVIFLFVIILTLIYHMLRRYMQFIVYTIFSPLFFLWGALPGQSSFGWFKSQLSNILAIPAMLLIIRLAAYIGFNSFNVGRLGDSGINLPSPFSIGAGSTTGLVADTFWFMISPLVSLVLLFYATKMPTIIDGILQIKDYGSRAGFGPMAVFSTPIGAAASAGKTISSIGSGVSSINKGLTAARNLGWGRTPARQELLGPPQPGGGPMPVYQPATPVRDTGKLAGLARGVAQVGRKAPPKEGWLSPEELNKHYEQQKAAPRIAGTSPMGKKSTDDILNGDDTT